MKSHVFHFYIELPIVASWYIDHLICRKGIYKILFYRIGCFWKLRIRETMYHILLNQNNQYCQKCGTYNLLPWVITGLNGSGMQRMLLRQYIILYVQFEPFFYILRASQGYENYSLIYSCIKYFTNFTTTLQKKWFSKKRKIF